MTEIKFCGLSRICDIEMVNRLRPEYRIRIRPRKPSGMYQWKSRRSERTTVTRIKAVGVFVNDRCNNCRLLIEGIIETAQLHSNEDEAY